MDADWIELRRELDLWSAEGRVARLWLRDDDAVSATPALDRLLALSQLHSAPILLGVIPMLARPCLVRALLDCTHITVAMHGIRHENHAAADERKQELPIALGHEAILSRLKLGRARLTGHFGAAAGGWYIPPWNRIVTEAAALLPQTGFKALSCFSGAGHTIPGLSLHNTHLDLISWRTGRIGKPPSRVGAGLAAELALARADGFRPVGVLAHHLDHDAAAWRSLSGLLTVTSCHPAVSWVAADDLLV